MRSPNHTATPSLASAALAYARAGWAVFPLAPLKKTPLHTGGVNDATTDEARVKRWWTANPKANIGVAVLRSGLGLIDLDLKPQKGKDGIAFLESLILVDGDLGDVATQRTPSGGRHHVFKRTGALVDRVDWRQTKSGVDILTKGHRYFVADPSVLEGGKRYAWDAPAPWSRVGKLSPVWATALRDDAVEADDPLLGKPTAQRVTSEDLLLDSAALRVPGVSMEELKSILAALDPTMARDPWLRVLWGAAAQWSGTKHEEQVIDALEEWSSSTSVDGQYKEGEVAERWSEHTARKGGTSGGGHVTWRGVRAMAREAGWSPFSIGGINPKEWKSHLNTKRVNGEEGEAQKNVVIANDWNASLIVAYDKRFSMGVRRNVLTDAIELHKPELAPLRDPTRLPVVYNARCDHIGVGNAIKDTMVGQRLGREAINGAVEAAATVHAYDPMKEWLESLAWDGKKRLDTWLTRVCGVEDNALNRAIARKWVVGMAGRGSAEYDGRGVKMDSVLVLQGGEGLGKSTIGAIFGGEWYSEFSNSLHNDDVYYVIESSMVLEFPELDAMGRSDASRVKALVSSQSDKFRRKYDRNAAKRPRRCVFLGTVNDETFLTRDMTMRRWWVVKCPGKMFDLRWLRDNRDQLIAEAKVAWDQGELPLLPVDVRKAHKDSVEDARMAHPYEEAIADWMDSVRKQASVKFKDAIEGALGRSLASLSMHELRKFGECMRAAGWKKSQLRAPDGSRTKIWVRLRK